MYSLLTEFRDGDNVVTTMLEHNSNFVPWYALCREILPRFGRRVECRLARFDPATGRLDLDHLASLVDRRTKLVCCTGASNFFGTKPDLAAVRRIADASGYRQPDGERRSLLLVDGAQLVPSSRVDVQALDVDYLSFSFHKLLAPFGVGVLYAKEHLLRDALPFLYGGDMIAEGQVSPGSRGLQRPAVEVRRGHARTSSASSSRRRRCGCSSTWSSARRRDPAVLRQPSARCRGPPSSRRWTASAGTPRQLTARALRALGAIDGLTVYGPATADAAHAAGRLQRGRHEPVRRRRGARPSTASSPAPAATAPRWPTANSGSTRRPAAGSASTSTTRSRTSTGRTEAVARIAGHGVAAAAAAVNG